MGIKKYSSFFSIILFLFLVAAAFILLLNPLLQKPVIHDYLLGTLSEATGYQLESGKIRIGFLEGFEISIDDIKTKSESGDEKFAALNVRIAISLRKLIKGQIAPTRIFLFKPRIEFPEKKIRSLSKTEHGAGISNVLSGMLANLFEVSAIDGQIIVGDNLYELNNFFLDISQSKELPGKLDSAMRGSLLFRKVRVPFSMKGSITLDESKKNPPCIDMSVKLSGIPATWIPKSKILPVEKGIFKADLRLKTASEGKLTLNGKIGGTNILFYLHVQNGSKEYAIPSLTADFQAEYADKIISLSSLKLESSDCTLMADLRLNIQDASDPFIDLKLSSLFMPLKTFKSYFPTPLLKRWIERKLFPYFTGGKARLDLLSLQGTVSRIKKLGLIENKSVFFMNLSLKDMETFKGQDVLSVQGTSGKVRIENGKLNVSDAKGTFGNSRVDNASMSIDSLYSGTRLYHFTINGLFNLADLKKQAKIDIIPDFIKKHAQKITVLSGDLKADCIDIDYVHPDYPKINTCTLRLTDCCIKHQDSLFPMSIKDAVLFIDDKAESRVHAKGIWGNSVFNFSFAGNNMFKTGKANLAFKAAPEEIIKQFFNKTDIALYCNELLPGELSMERGKDGNWSCQGMVNFKRAVVEAESFPALNLETGDGIVFDMALLPEDKINFNLVRFNLGKSCLDFSGSFDLKDKDSLIFNVSTQNLFFKDIERVLKQRYLPEHGVMTCNARINTSISDFSKTIVNGSMQAKNIACIKKWLPYKIRDCDFKINFSGKDVVIPFFTFRIYQTPVLIHGKLKGWDGLKGDLKVNGNYFDFSELIDSIIHNSKKISFKEPGRFIENSYIRFFVNIKEGRWKKFQYSPLSADISLLSGNLIIDHCNVKMDKGHLALTGYITSGIDAAKFLSLYLDLKQYPFQDIVESFGLEKRIVVSDLDLTAEGFLAIKSDNNDSASGLTGSINILLEDGVIKKSHLLFTILDFLSVQNIVDQNPSDIKREGFYFKSIAGNITIDKGFAFTRNISMKSSVFNAAGEGSVELGTEKIDSNIAIAPLGSMDYLLSKIPLVGYVLTGDDKTFFTFYIKVGGILSKPSIIYIPFTRWPASVFGFVKRAFLTPGRIFKGITKAKEEMMEKGIMVPEYEQE